MLDRQYRLWVTCLVLLTAIPTLCRAELDIRAEWRRKISMQLAAHKQFPSGAFDQAGEATVRFVFDRSGKLISNELVKSTGVPQLDAAALAMVENSQPFPEPPAEIGDDKFSFDIPVVFRGRTRSGGDDIRDDAITHEQKYLAGKLRPICRGC